MYILYTLLNPRTGEIMLHVYEYITVMMYNSYLQSKGCRGVAAVILLSHVTDALLGHVCTFYALY